VHARVLLSPRLSIFTIMAGGFCPCRSSCFGTLHLVGSPRVVHVNFWTTLQASCSPSTLASSLTEFLSLSRVISSFVLFFLLTLYVISVTPVLFSYQLECLPTLHLRASLYYIPATSTFHCPHTYLLYGMTSNVSSPKSSCTLGCYLLVSAFLLNFMA